VPELGALSSRPGMLDIGPARAAACTLACSARLFPTGAVTPAPPLADLLPSLLVSTGAGTHTTPSTG